MKRKIATAVAVGLIGCFLSAAVFAETAQQLEQKALQAMQAGEYERAARILEKSLQQQPGNPRALYNLACCFSRLGELRPAAEHLEQAWQAGLRDPELLRGDPDLQALRDSRSGATLIERLASEEERQRRLRGELQQFEAGVLGGLRVVAPTEMKAGKKYPLVVILHGHGANPENYAGLFDRVDTPLEAVVCAPYGPYPIFHGQGRGYSWYPEPAHFRELLDRRGTEADRALRREELENLESGVSDSYVLTAIEAMKRRYPVDPNQIYVMGHSEGGVLAYGVALRNPGIVRGLIVVGSRLRERDASAKILAGAAGRLQALICHSRDDQAAEFDLAKTAHKTLEAAGIQSKLVPYVGGHGLTADLIRTIARWIGHPDRVEKAGN